MRHSGIWLPLAAALLITACANKEEPAKQLVAGAETSIAEVRDDATIYAPEELKAAEEKLAAAKENITWQKYQDVLDQGPELKASVTTLKDTVISKKTQAAAATHEWTTLTEEVPKVIQALEGRLDALSKARKLPAEVKKETFEAAKTELETLKTTWAQAGAAFNAGQATEAADKGRAVKARAEELLQQLGLSPV